MNTGAACIGAPPARIEWSERRIAAALSRDFFRRQFVVVDRCNWTGHECDLLVVSPSLHIIDVEIKISRSDLRADAKKDKWWRHIPYRWNEARPEPEPLTFPRKVWKHYYAMPAEIWRDDLVAAIHSTASGILLLRDSHGAVGVDVWRRATVNRDAPRITTEQAIDIARLANLRMWDAYREVEAVRHWRDMVKEGA